MRVWYTRCQVPTGLPIALKAGLLNAPLDDGQPVEWVALQDAGDPVIAQSHFTHAQPDSLRFGSSYPAIWAQANGADTRIVAMSSITGAQQVLVRPDADIKTAADLKGKRLLVVRRPDEPIDYLYAVSLRLYRQALDSAGLTLQDVTLVEKKVDRPFIADRVTPGLKQTQMPEPSSGTTFYGQWRDLVLPLLSGEVDAIISGGGIGAPTLLFSYLLGLRPVFDMDSQADELARANNSTPLVLAVKRPLLERYPAFIVNFLAGLLRVPALARQEPERVIRELAAEQVVPEYLVRLAHGKGLDALLDIDITESQRMALRSQVAHLLDLGLITSSVDVDAWVDDSFLARARLFSANDGF